MNDRPLPLPNGIHLSSSSEPHRLTSTPVFEAIEERSTFSLWIVDDSICNRIAAPVKHDLTRHVEGAVLSPPMSSEVSVGPSWQWTQEHDVERRIGVNAFVVEDRTGDDSGEIDQKWVEDADGFLPSKKKIDIISSLVSRNTLFSISSLFLGGKILFSSKQTPSAT